MKSCDQFVEIEIIEAIDVNFVFTKGKCEKIQTVNDDVY